MLKVLERSLEPPIDPEIVKLHCSIDHSDLDTLLDVWQRAAVGVVEHKTGLVLQPTSFELQLDCWPPYHSRSTRFAGGIELPAKPIRSVDEIAYLDVAGAEQVVDAADWHWHSTSEGGEVYFVDGFSPPVLVDRPNAILVRFSAGFDDPAASGSGDDPVFRRPPQLDSGILFLLAHWTDQRGSVNVGNIVNQVPDTLDLVLGPLRVYR